MKMDEWMKAALIDDTLVAKALLAFKNPPAPVPVLQWGRRKSRYRPALVIAKKDKESTRLSPTTPLSWSGDTTVSGSDDFSAARSKDIFTDESLKSARKKRSARKRSFAELKEEENLLLNERLHLERDLASAHKTVMQQRAISKKLKTVKFNLGLKSTIKIGQTSTQPQLLAGDPKAMDFPPISDSNSTLPKHNTCSDLASKSVFRDSPKYTGTFGSRGFVLPDLNMKLSEDGTTP